MKAGVPLPDITAQYLKAPVGRLLFVVSGSFVYRQVYIPHGYAHHACLAAGGYGLQHQRLVFPVMLDIFSAWVPFGHGNRDAVIAFFQYGHGVKENLAVRRWPFADNQRPRPGR